MASSSGVIIWRRHLGSSSGAVIWRRLPTPSSGVVIWGRHLTPSSGVVTGVVIWRSHLASSSGVVIWRRHLAPSQASSSGVVNGAVIRRRQWHHHLAFGRPSLTVVDETQSFGRQRYHLVNNGHTQSVFEPGLAVPPTGTRWSINRRPITRDMADVSGDKIALCSDRGNEFGE